MIFWNYVKLFLIVVLAVLLVAAAFEYIWNHLFYYIFDSVFNYKIPVINYEQSFSILLAIFIIRLLFMKVVFTFY